MAVKICLSFILTACFCCLPFMAEPSLGAYEMTLHSANGLTINITQTGVYKVLVDGDQWLHSADTFFTADGKPFSIDLGNLTPSLLTHVTPGQDHMGEFTYITFSLTMKAEKRHTVTTSFRAYKKIPAIVFSQIFPEGLDNTSVNDADCVCTGFPTFQIGGRDIGFMSYGGRFLSTTQFGRWSPGAEGIQSGLYGGPLVLFNDIRRTMVIATFSEFMAGSVYHDMRSNSVQYGVMGRATSIPKGFVYETVLMFGNDIKQTIAAYGEMLMKQYDKSRDFMKHDVTINSLSYWTDNGAYYYHKTDPRTYEDILLNVKTYAESNDIPYRSLQLDAWWYYTGDGGGVKNWTAMPSVFPNGLPNFYSKLRWPLAAHNKYWASNTDYAKLNGGKWNFIVEKRKNLALPLNQDFWNFLLSNSKKWGLALYEQDFLDKQFGEMDICVENVTVGRQWLMMMGAAANSNNLPIQYCMPMARHLLQSVEIPSVTQSRASDDYAPGNSQWDIGLSSILLDAIGLAPFKDNFWTTSEQPNNPYDRSEPYPALQSMVATFSTGPVGISDMIGISNVSLIMRSVNADGVILKPSRPAMAVNGYLQHRAFGSGGVNGLIWSTVSHIPNPTSTYTFGHILVFEVDEPMKLDPRGADLYDEIPVSWTFNHRDPINSLQTFDFKNTINLPLLLRKDFQLWHTTPYIEFGSHNVLILGELSKWVTVSPQRITFIKTTHASVTLTIAGAVGENVQIDIVFDMKHSQPSCTICNSIVNMTIFGPDKVQCVC